MAKADLNERPMRVTPVSLLRGFLRAATLVGLGATLISFGANHHWFLDLIAQLRFQLSLGALVVLLLLLCTRCWWFAMACLAGLAINLWPMVPYLIVAGSGPKTLESERVYRLLTCNVLTHNRQWDRLKQLIKEENPDFIVLMEVDYGWKSTFSGTEGQYPYQFWLERSDNFGIAMLSKFEWGQITSFESAGLQLPTIDARFDGILINGKPLRLIGTHPIPPIGSRKWRHRNDQLMNVAARFDSATSNVMTGDFNLTPWSPWFGRVLKTGDLSDSAVGQGVQPTWYLGPTWLGGLKLDHVLIGKDVSVVDHRVAEGIGSDHRPVVVDIR